MYLVAGSSGKVGGAVVEALLARKRSVRIYVRSEAKARDLAARGAEIAVGTFEDVGALTNALRGVTAAFLMQPNDFGSHDFIEDGARRAQGYRAALEACGSPRVVGLSSVGAQHLRGNGPIDREARFEAVFREYGKAAFLRPAYFMENWANVLDAVRGPGIVPTFLTPGKPIEMVAVRDIGTSIADLLEKQDAPRITELGGPEEYTPEQVASAFGELLGRPIHLAPEAPAGLVPLFTKIGFTPHIAELVQEMYEGYAKGTMRFAGRPVRGTTGLRETLAALVGAVRR